MAKTHLGDGRTADIDSVVSVGVEAARPVIGLLALSEDRVVAGEIGTFLANRDIEMLATRVGMPPALTLDGFGHMGEAFRRGAASLSTRCSLVAVACASAAVAIGPARLTEIVEGSLPGATAVEPISASVESLTERSVERIALVTPYASETHQALAGLLEKGRITVAADLRLRVPTGYVPSDVAPASIYEAIDGAEFGNVEALVISCTALSTAQLLEDLEAHLRIPVVTTNRALAESVTRRLEHL